MNHEHFMNRCLQLAEMGRGRVSPNPLVGAVVVHNNRIIGEGYHRQFGGPHAEVNAIEDVEDEDLLRESIIYVSLEPCSHYGKTPPCADLIIRSGIPRVVVCNTDPNPLVGGMGIQRLRNNGVEVTTGVLKEKGRWVNRVFFKAIEQNLPYITLKWAQTSDGYMGRTPGTGLSGKISGIYSDKLVHKMRAENDAILIGSGTLVQDNPSLTTRLWPGKNPVRVILAADPDISGYYVGQSPPETIVLDSKNDLKASLKGLVDSGLHSVLVEGGTKVLHSFIDQGLWDEIIIINSQDKWQDGVSAPIINDKPYRVRKTGTDLWQFYRKTT